MDLLVRGADVFSATGPDGVQATRDTVVFIHGVGQDSTIWVLPRRYFVRHGRNVLAFDLPGHGRSAGPPLKTIEDMADWLTEALDAAGVRRVAVVGHSMGSLVGLEFAARHPDRIRALAMVGVSVPIAVSERLMESAELESHDAIDMLTYWGHSRSAQMGGSPTPGMWMVVGGMRLWEMAEPETIYADLRACDEYVAGLDSAARVRCPSLLLLGEKDAMTPVRVAQPLIDALPDQRTVVFEGAGHSLLAERSDPVLDELITIV